MPNPWGARCLLYLALPVALAPGCQMMYLYRPVAVQVRDAETKQPIPGAEVHLSYPLSRDSSAPYDSSARSGDDGIAHLRAAPYGDFGVRIDAKAPGHLADTIDASTERIRKLGPAYPFEAVERRPADLVLEMYAEPRFAVELVLPRGFRGPVKAEVIPQDDLPLASGRRVFRYAVSDAGTVQVRGPKVLRRLLPSDFRAVYADGTPLDERMSLTQVGFRWLSSEGATQCFVVGTQSEYDMCRRGLQAEEPVRVRHAQGRGGGRRHHCGGGDADGG